MGNLKYNELMEQLFFIITELPDVDMCGEESQAAFQILGERTDGELFFELESLMMAGFDENAFNGFCTGFQCAVLLILGNKPLPVPDVFGKVAAQAKEGMDGV